MKITIIHGSNRAGNTDKTIDIVKAKLNSFEEHEFVDFYLPKDLPMFCMGCYQCFDKGDFGGEFCPHRKYTHPILEAMKSSDGIIIASPVYVLAESGQVKAFLDHFGCIFMIHRPLEEMFSKKALVISTTAGAGTKYVTNTIERSLRYWGIPKVYRYGFAMHALNWNDMPEEKRKRYEKTLDKKTYNFYNSLKSKKVYTPLKTKVLFYFIKGLINSYPDGNKDKEYWSEMGWLQGERPWR